MSPSIRDHTIWPRLLPYLVSEPCPSQFRWRIEIRTPPERLVVLALRARCGCARCGKPIHPIRERHGWRTLYMRLTCSIACRNSKAAREEAAAIHAAIQRNAITQPDVMRAE